MEHHATKQLNIIVNHVPCHVVAARHPVVAVDGFVALNAHKVLGDGQVAVKVCSRHDNLLVFCKTTGSILDNVECHGHHLIKCLLIDVENFFFEFVNLVEYAFTFVNGRVFNLGFQSFNLLFLLSRRLLHILLNFFGSSTQCVIVECLYFWISSLDFIYNRLNQLHVTG